jgi:hypothetical protein
LLKRASAALQTYAPVFSSAGSEESTSEKNVTHIYRATLKHANMILEAAYSQTD